MTLRGDKLVLFFFLSYFMP